MNEFSAVLADLAADDPERNVSAIKSAVIERIREVDAKVTVESTEYFNHTFAPDLVLRWPGNDQLRRVYLRTNNNVHYLREDVELTAGINPILMPLLPLSAEIQREELERESAANNTLVTDPSTITAVGGESRERSVGGAVSRAVLQGGRGYLTRQRAKAVGHALSLGFVGAQKANISLTQRALDVASSLLDLQHVEELTRLLHAIWLGSGATAGTFPVSTEVSANLDAGALDLLLEVATTENGEFWRRIGRNLTLEQLCELVVPATSEGLQQLVTLNLDRLRAKSCQVDDPSNEYLGYPTPRWHVRSGMLTMDSERFRVHFSPNSVAGTTADGTEGDGYIGLRELIGRATAGNVRISEVSLEVPGGRQIDYKAASDSDILSDDVLQELEVMLGSSVIVRAAVSPLGSGLRQLRCDYTKGSASGRTGAKFYVIELLSTAVPLLRALTTSERAFIRGVVERFDAAP
ncbi:hypothetical protein [Nonomuraea bangladeshensis]|uniref:hypothetical protein n=1 Tax=Nonomuraea bangladeshensis TaxID=404385 RepID=UPI003C30016F